ncbi:hypothetical protein DFR41_104233 [Pseudacidovorax intermedius]|uniref:Lipoprotein n=1 Tax=Pseudacidovorax intermedius TaxID=433924 RepID=A0A370FFI4_9BURK|nr:hypothetical protein [Pseudacidovorax intermedius]RDI25177.1 hypothetical protein DFR41_104233 [Pseudacidovorax intermedius]
MKLWRLLGAVLAVVALAGCAVGPVDAQRLQQSAADALPVADNAVRFVSPVEWHANTRGFSDARNLRMASYPKSGVIVLTNQSIYIEQWDSDRFSILKRIPIARLIEASIDTFGGGDRLVLQLDDYETHTFLFVDSFSIVVSRGKAREFWALMPSAIRK